MSRLGTVLALVELVGTPAVLLWLALAPRRAAALAVVLFGFVFANPIGVVARERQVDPRPLVPTARADTAVRWVRVAGVPVAWYVPYQQSYVYSGENSPTGALKLRYGFSFLPSTGASTVVGSCSNDISTPCWRGDYPLVQRGRDGTVWIVPLTETYVGSRTVHVPHFYEVGLGLASPLALAYWLVATPLLLRAFRRRIAWRALGAAVAASAAAGLAVALAVSAHRPARPAGEAEPALIPKARAAPAATATARFVPLGAGDGAEGPAAAAAGAGVVAVWLVRRNDPVSTQLRARLVARDGRPAGPDRLLLTWRYAPTGRASCETPGSVRAAAAGGRVVVAWNDRCGTVDHPGPARIHVLVLRADGRPAGAPVVATAFAAAQEAEEPPPFALAANADGRVLLVWVARDGMKSAFLGRHLRAGPARQIAAGSLVDAVCARTCAVVRRPKEAGVELLLLGADAAVVRTARIRERPAVAHSDPVATARGDSFYVGWTASPTATTAVVRVARVDRNGDVTATPLGHRFATGSSESVVVPPPLGIAFRRGEPELIWVLPANPKRPGDTTKLFAATRRSRTVLRVDGFVGDSVVPSPPGRLLVALTTGPGRSAPAALVAP